MEVKASVSRESRDLIGLIYCTTISASTLEFGFFVIARITAMFHTSSSFGLSQPQSFAMQSWPYLLLPVASLSVLLPACHSVWMRSPRSTCPYPRGTAIVMVTMPITVTERKAVSRGRPKGVSLTQMVLQSSALHSLLSSLVLWQQSSPVFHASRLQDLFAWSACGFKVALKSLCFCSLLSGQAHIITNKQWHRPSLYFMCISACFPKHTAPCGTFTYDFHHWTPSSCCWIKQQRKEAAGVAAGSRHIQHTCTQR